MPYILELDGLPVKGRDYYPDQEQKRVLAHLEADLPASTFEYLGRPLDRFRRSSLEHLFLMVLRDCHDYRKKWRDALGQGGPTDVPERGGNLLTSILLVSFGFVAGFGMSWLFRLIF